jgi:hypothetical protein
MKRPATIAIGLATLPLALGYAIGGRWIGAGVSVAVGCLWLIGLRRGWSGTDTLGLVGFTGLATVGVLLALAAPILLAGQVAALAAWDLDRFAERMRSAGRVEDAADLTRAHLVRLLAATGTGLVLGSVALGMQLPLSFGWALLLAALIILGLSRAIGWLNRAGD